MQCACGTEALSPYTRDAEDFGTTRTQTAQQQFAQRLRGVLGRLNARIREAIIDRDLLKLQGDDTEALVDDPPDEIFETRQRRTAVAAFFRWLRNQLQEYYLSVVGEEENQFIRQAYAAGIRFANRQLGEQDVVVDSDNIADVVSRPKHAQMLRRLSRRTFENLESVTEDMVPAIRDTLVEGLDEGKNPREIARDINGRVDSIGKHRSTMIARSEVVNAYSQSTLEQYRDVAERQDLDIGLRHGEWLATPDNRTCTFCRRLSGATLTFDEMESGRVVFRGQEYRLLPPSHPNGRCSILPSMGVDPESLPPLEERVPGTPL